MKMYIKKTPPRRQKPKNKSILVVNLAIESFFTSAATIKEVLHIASILDSKSTESTGFISIAKCIVKI